MVPIALVDWMAEGGSGYLFRDDETFAADVLAGHLPVFTPEDLTPADPLTS